MPKSGLSNGDGENGEKKKGRKSRIATDTPEKNEIMMDRQKKQDKTKVQGVKRVVLKEKNVEMKVPKKRKHFILEESRLYS